MLTRYVTLHVHGPSRSHILYFKNVFGVLTATQPCFLSPIPRHMHGKPDYLQKNGHVMTQSK